MAFLKRRGKVWYAYWWQDGKKRGKALSPVKSEADRKLSEINEQVTASRYGHKNIKISWQSFVEKYLDYSHTNKKPQTYERDKRTLVVFQRLFTIQSPHELTSSLLEEYKSKRKEQGKKETTINRDLGLLKAMLRKAQEWGYISENEGKSVKKLKVGRTPPRFFNRAEIEAIIDNCNDLYEEAMVTTAMLTGMRREEICRLKWEDIDWSRKVIKVIGRDGWTPKDYESREIPLFPALERILQRWKNQNDKAPYIFSLHGRKMEGVYFHQLMRRILKNVGIRGNFQTMRHTFASSLANAGIDLFRIAKWMGHASVKTTEIYSHYKPFDKDDPVLKLDYGNNFGNKN